MEGCRPAARGRITVAVALAVGGAVLGGCRSPVPFRGRPGPDSPVLALGGPAPYIRPRVTPSPSLDRRSASDRHTVDLVKSGDDLALVQSFDAPSILPDSTLDPRRKGRLALWATKSSQMLGRLIHKMTRFVDRRSRASRIEGPG